jgi:predicted nuclease of predicted toxin-antitoxin system
MNLIADEGVEQQIVERLRQEGHSVWYVREMTPGIADDDVLSLSNRHSAPLVTADKDFGELVFRQRLTSSGVILLRLGRLSATVSSVLVAQRMAELPANIEDVFVTITPGKSEFGKELTAKLGACSAARLREHSPK